MKKLIILLSISLLSAVGFSSCQRCQSCSYSYTDTSGEVITSPVGEACGDEAELDQLEINCETAAATVGGDCVCTAN